MVDKIEVYIRSEEVITGEAVGGRVVAEHGCTVIRGSKTDKVMSEADRTALEVASQFAHERGLQVAVCNLGTFAGRVKARQKGIKTTPTIVIGASRIEGELAPELLRTKMESALKA
jgi:hypothetical protein